MIIIDIQLTIPRRIAREIVFPVVVGLKLEKLFSFLHNHNRLVLVYHGVVTLPDHSISPGPIAVKQFEKHLSYYKQNFDVVSLDSMFQMYRDDFIPKKKTIALTFDDGYENNYTYAAPLLKRYDFPATMYIISQCIEDDNRLTWYDYVDLIKNHLDVEQINMAVFGRDQIHTVPQLRSFIKMLNITQRNVLYDQIRKLVRVEDYIPKYPRENWKLMDKQCLKELSKSTLIEIGAHSHNHPNLGEINIEDAKREVVDSKKLIEQTINKEVRSIAFPDGSYTDAVKKVCLEAGFKNLLAVNYRCASDISDKSILPRYGLSSTTTFESNMIQVNRQFKNYGF